jgi:hypothetical protein
LFKLQIPRFAFRPLTAASAPMVLILACTGPAEHSNPLDPQSPNYTTRGAIAGRVTGFYQPYQPLAGALIKLQPLGFVIESDRDGGFRFTDLAPQPYSLEITAAGYAGESQATEVFARQTSLHEFHLDGLPVVQLAQVTSAHVSTRESSDDRFFLEIITEVSDPDGANDIKKARVEIPARAFADTLARGSGPARWQRLFSPAELAAIDLYNLTGIPFQIVAEDFPGKETASSPFFLTRVIAEVPEAISPANSEMLTTDAPTFRWQTPATPFGHTFRVEVFRLDAGFPTFIAAIGNIAAGTMSIKYVGRLSSGTYYWTVKIIDAFGNSSRSKEAAFQIQ